ncbi:MAG: cellulose synthase subunit BcsC-related outer membrane protein [Desulfovibrionaceae bacterium]|nr:cellulose synthase subunit BcsC-related outer membrane protein [Desulfovibrionaceae bacterium]
MTRNGMTLAMALAAVAMALGPGAPVVHAEGLDATQQELLRNAQIWASRNHPALARQNVDKLLALVPDSPQGLAMLGNIALLENKPEEAQRILARLRARQPGHRATADLAILVRVYGPDHEKLAQMRLLAQAGRKAEAAGLARALFPEGPPVIGGLAAEYYQIVGSDKRAAAQADSALARLYQSTGDASYRLAELELQLDQGAPALELARQFETLTTMDTGVDPQRLQALWRRALKRLDNTAAAKPRLQAYLRRYPDDRGVAEQLGIPHGPAVAHPEPPQETRPAAAHVERRPPPNADHAAQAVQRREERAARHQKDHADELGQQGQALLRQGRHAQAQALFAQAQRLSPQRKWQELSDTARFWRLLRQADEAAQAERLDEAAQYAQQALAMQPAHAEALVTLAGIRTRQGNATQAQTLYEQALAAEPAHSGALRALAALREQQAMDMLQALRSPPGQAEQPVSAGAGMPGQEAGPDAALRLLQEATALTPSDPWLRHRLARLYLQLGQRDEALRVMDEGIAVHQSNHESDDDPAMIDMRYARALIRSAADDDAGALADMEFISPELRSASMRALFKSASVYVIVAHAAEPGADADTLLGSAERLAGNDTDLLFSIANAWFRRGQDAQGVAVFERLTGRAPSPAARLDHAALLGRAGDDDRLASLLPALLAEPGWTPEQTARLFAVQTSHLERLTQAAAAAGDRAQALRLAQTSLYQAEAQPASQQAYARGRLLYAAQDYAGAARQLEQALEGDADQAGKPMQADVRLALGNALALQGQSAQAREQAQWLARHLSQDDVTGQLALLRLWQRLPAMDEARALARQLLERFPQDADVLLHAARLERAQDNYAQALTYFRQAGEIEKNTESQPRLDKIETDIRAIEERRQAWVETGMERLTKNSTSGISSLRGWEIPAVIWVPVGYDGHYFLHVDQVRLDAGNLPASAQQAETYGQVAAWPAAAYPAPPDRPRGNGLNLGFGYRGDGIEWDVGAIGVGFPVTNLVGGISHSYWSEDFSYRIELARRPLTGSLLSYAGARDPITGQDWGGIVATGVAGRISRPLGPYSASLGASYALLQGRNVENNTSLQLRAAIDRDVLRKPHETVNMGLSLSWWSYKHDLSEFTWGQGGYYSPRSYLSLALPVEWSGRRGAFTWLLRGSISLAHSSSRASNYYANSPALQTQAFALDHTPVYAGDDSSGFGRSLQAVVEYQVSPSLALGAQLSINRSAYYAPTRLMVYLRYFLSPVVAPLQDRPRPVQPYSRF